MTYERYIAKIRRSSDEAEIKALCRLASLQFDDGSWRESGATVGIKHAAFKRLDAMESANRYVGAISSSSSEEEIEAIKSKALNEPDFTPDDMVMISSASFGRLKALGCEL